MTAQLSEAELLEFLFLPGFSTAEQVTEISGRGVGLDIAKTMVQDVGGLLRVQTELGKGTAFHFQLPLTLSVIRALLVEIGGEPYAFNLNRIDRVLMVQAKAIATTENQPYITVDGENISLVHALQILELPASPQDFKEELPVILLSDHTHRYAVIVERFLGERDLVVRPLDMRLGKVQDVSAAAIAENGQPILIVDVADLVRTIDKLVTGGDVERLQNSISNAVETKTKRVLVVDDSITVREMERKLLQNQGYHVDVAVNGMEGWNSARSGDYDLIITDIDMPRMNGIELVQHLKSQPQLKTIPIIIVSYKDREEDQLAGLDAGADYYLTKSSFHDNSLINAVVDLIGVA
jgi:two-component system sensor histidine kinase and response regulator WspE